MSCRNCDVESFPFEVDGEYLSASELIKKAEEGYGCQAETSLKITSVACKCLSQHDHEVYDRRDLVRKLI